MKSKYTSNFGLLLLLTGWVLPITAFAQTREFDLVSIDSMINLWPGPDGLLGSADDVFSSDRSTNFESEPNIGGAFSYNAFDLVGNGSFPDTTLLPTPMNAVSFLTGTISVNLAAGSGVPLFESLMVSGTEPYPGDGPYSAELIQTISGGYDPWDGFFAQTITLSKDFLGLESGSSGSFLFSGNAIIVESNLFESGIGDAYVDEVLIPIAQSLEAGSLLFVRGGGILPNFMDIPMESVFFGVSAIPEPSTYALIMASALAGLLLIWRRFTRR